MHVLLINKILSIKKERIGLNLEQLRLPSELLISIPHPCSQSRFLLRKFADTFFSQRWLYFQLLQFLCDALEPGLHQTPATLSLAQVLPHFGNCISSDGTAGYRFLPACLAVLEIGWRYCFFLQASSVCWPNGLEGSCSISQLDIWCNVLVKSMYLMIDRQTAIVYSFIRLLLLVPLMQRTQVFIPPRRHIQLRKIYIIFWAYMGCVLEGGCLRDGFWTLDAGFLLAFELHCVDTQIKWTDANLAVAVGDRAEWWSAIFRVCEMDKIAWQKPLSSAFDFAIKKLKKIHIFLI